MRKIALLFSSVVALAALAGCNKEIAPGTVETPQSDQGVVLDEASVPEGAVPGVLVVKFEKAPQGLDEIRGMLPQLNITDAERTFPDDPRFPNRIKESGLDRWYNVHFDKWALMTKAARIAFDSENVEHIDYVVAPKLNSLPFNDPMLSKQWHYINDGTLSFMGKQAVAGADINVEEAWKTQRGSEDVIVCICDSGVDYSHEDLADAMWINEAEYYGQQGVDDDGNGYVDDIYGYNFCTYDGNKPIGKIVPQSHGTHCAGTVGAVNDNGIGVCGIAGGDATHKGVRLMTVQTNQDNTVGAFLSTAIYYAANNGAVVMNCSWGLPSGYSESLEEAIRYFCKYAGTDDNGNQTGPIAGGVIIFAAGNDNSSTEGVYPSNMDEVVCVTAFGPDMVKSYYSNYGDFADIAAPGGDYNSFGNPGCVYSTTVDEYVYMQGTSMAAPHVTGVSALIVSQFKGQGVTAEMIKDILLDSANPDLYDHNPGYKNSKALGVGRVDAAKAISFSTEGPAEITEFKEASLKGNSVTLSWKVPEVQQGKPAMKYVIINLKSSTEEYESSFASTASVSEWESATIGGLSFNTAYTATFTAQSAGGGNTVSSKKVNFTVGKNNPPKITALDGTTLTLKSFETKSLRFKVTDEDGHDIKLSITGDTGGVTLGSLSGDEVSLSFNAVKMNAGNYSLTLVASDSYDKSSLNITYTVKENTPPVVSKALENVVLSSSTDSKTIDLSQYFTDADGETLKYTAVVNSASKILTGEVAGSQLTLKGNWYGYVTVDVKAYDAKEASVSQTFRALVRDGSQEVDLYPVPVKTVLNVRTGENESGTLTVYNATGGKVFDQAVTLDPFSPATVDFTNLPSGVYSVSVKTGSKDFKKNITKE